MRAILNCSAGVVFTIAAAAAAAQEESAGKRVASIAAVAVEEYRLGVDTAGVIVSQMELEEARAFFGEARDAAARMNGANAAAVAALVDSLAHAVNSARPSRDVDAMYARLVSALGPDAALDLPGRPLDLAAGRGLYERHCASCHGMNGMGDGPQAAALDPPPPALADTAMRGVTPSLMYRVVAIGIQGTAMAGWSGTLDPNQRWDVVAYLNTLRAREGAATRGAELFAAACDDCSESTRTELADFGWLSERSDDEIADLLRSGAADRGIPRLATSDEDAYAIVAHLRDQGARTVASAKTRVNAAEVERAVLQLLGQALDAARQGDGARASSLAFDAYIAFEPVENTVRARDPGLIARVESDFLTFRGATRGGDVASAEAALDRIRTGLDDVVGIATATTRAWAAFGQSLIIILREGFEAILIIGAVIAFLMRTGNRARVREVWVGTVLALLASAGTAVVLSTILANLPATREIIEGATMLVAVAVLFSVSYWILSRVEARRWTEYIRSQVGVAVNRGGRAALVGVAFLVVYREGAETVLFYQALLQSGTSIGTPVLAGFVAGAALLGVVYFLFSRLGVRLPLRPFFATTGVLLYLMAFVFLGNGLRELQEGGAVPITAVSGAPTIDALGIYPTVETLAGQGLLLALFVLACWQSLRSMLMSRRYQADPVLSSSEPASTARHQRRSQARSSARG